jgi:hypothetical protein
MSYQSSEATASWQLLISGALLPSLAESAITTVLYKHWDNRHIFITLFSISLINHAWYLCLLNFTSVYYVFS